MHDRSVDPPARSGGRGPLPRVPAPSSTAGDVWARPTCTWPRTPLVRAGGNAG